MSERTDIPGDTGEGTTVFYDGACPLCRREIAFMKGLDDERRVRFADVSVADAPLPPGKSREDMLARFHVRAGDGTLRDGAAGFATVWAELRGLRWLGRFARVPGVLPVLERLYRIFLRVRPRLQRLAARWDRA